MFGSICGDVLGSTWEFHTTKVYGFPLYPEMSSITDDTVCTAAIASALLRGRPFDRELRAWVAASSQENFGPRFQAWAGLDDGMMGDSAGNGACMRVSAIPLLSDGLAHALDLASGSCKTSHHHPDSIRAAMATVAAARLAHEGWGQEEMGQAVAEAFGFDLATPLAAYRAIYTFEPLAVHTVGPSLRGVVEATSFEDGMRRIISMGGDADTMASTAGGALEAYHAVPDDIRAFVMARVPTPIRQVLAAYREAVAAKPIVATPVADVPRVMREALERALAPPPRPRAAWVRALDAIGAYATKAARVSTARG